MQVKIKIFLLLGLGLLLFFLNTFEVRNLGYNYNQKLASLPLSIPVGSYDSGNSNFLKGYYGDVARRDEPQQRHGDDSKVGDLVKNDGFMAPKDANSVAGGSASPVTAADSVTKAVDSVTPDRPDLQVKTDDNAKWDPEIASEKVTSDFKSPDNDHMHGILGVDNSEQLWKPTPLKKPLREWTAAEERESHKEFCFNSVLSNALPLDRPRWDKRVRSCAPKIRAMDTSNMKPATIIFVFFDELFSTLIRSVHSALNNAPPELVGEIVLVDDGSSIERRPELGALLEKYVRRGLPKTRLSRLRERSGLMRARMHGADLAKFENLVFLDSHIECSPGWLEPLLAQMTEDYRIVPLPVIESIDAHDFEKIPSGIEVLGHSWRLGQDPVPGRTASPSEPNDSPIMAGGLFAITKRWFNDLGQYDPELQQYGGEEMEISFKIWQCGGRIRSIPCSRIGHVFRTGKYWQGQVFFVDSNIIVRNKLRAAHVWMDEAAKIVSLAFAPLPKSLPLGDLSVPRKVRDTLKCHDYNWYHKEVYPELFFPELKNSRGGALRGRVNGEAVCVDTMMQEQVGRPIGSYPCHYQHGSQAFLLTGDGMLRVAMSNFVQCLSVRKGEIQRDTNMVILEVCNNVREKWVYESNDDSVGKLRQGDMCLQPTTNDRADPRAPASPFSLHAVPCAENDATLLWEFVGDE